MTGDMTPDQEYEFYARPENQEPKGAPIRRRGRMSAPEKLSIPVDRVVQATSVPGCSAPSVGGCVGVISVGRSSSFPLWKTAPARTKATRCGALTARQRAAAASMSL